MKTKKETKRILALVLALVMITSTVGVIYATVCKKNCNCSCNLEIKTTGIMLFEGKKVTIKRINKTIKVIWKGKVTKNYSVKQLGKIVKTKNGRYKITIIKGSAKKNIWIKVNPITGIYIKQTKMPPLIAGSKFDNNVFKQKSVVMGEYKKGSDKQITSYTVIAPKKKLKAGKALITVVYTNGNGKKFKDNIYIPVVDLETPTITPTEIPIVTPTGTPEITPTTVVSTETPTGTPIMTSTVTPEITPTTVVSTVTPTGTSIAVPTITPTGTSIAVPTITPTGTSIAVPTITPTGTSIAVPTVTPIIPSTPNYPIVIQTKEPTEIPTMVPTGIPTTAPTEVPTMAPTGIPTTAPTEVPTTAPTEVPTTAPTGIPTTAPTEVPTMTPTEIPTMTPTGIPPTEPTNPPTEESAKYYQSEINGATIKSYDGEITENGIKDGTHVYLKADVPKGMYVDTWIDKDGNILRRGEEEYDFHVSGDFSITVTYSPTEVKAIPIVHFTANKYELFPENQSVKFFMAIEIPNGYERKEMGFIYTSKLPDEEMVIENTSAKKVVNGSSYTGSSDWNYTLKFPSISWENKTLVKIRCYATVTSPEGIEENIYSEVISFKLESE